MKNKLIKMHNELAMARYKMTLSEQKLFIYAIKNIDQDKANFPTSSFMISDFAKDAELNLNHLYNEIDEISTGIMKTLIFIRNDKNPNKWKKYNLTDNCVYDNGRITFKFNDSMSVFLLQLQKHYYLQAPIVITFNSWYSMRLYDMFKAHSYKNENLIISLDELKELLDLKGKYQRFNNFREKVVDVALKEINAKSDISITFEKETVGMKVVGLIFTIEEDTERYLKEIEYLNDIDEIRLRANLTDTNFNNKQLLDLYESAVARFGEYRDADDLYLYMSINYQYTKKQKQDGNIYGYYKSCLDNDHAKAIPQILSGYTISSFA